MRLPFVCAALALAASTAAAKPSKVVVLPFQGPPSLAYYGRAAVIGALQDRHLMMSPKKWDDALRFEAMARPSSAHGVRWALVAKQTRVDAIIDGYVTADTRGLMLHVVVREAATHDLFDEIAVPLGERGPSDDGNHKLSRDLGELMSYFEVP